MGQLFTSGGQSIGASASVLPVFIQGWFLLGLTGLSHCCPRDPQESSLAPQFESIHSSVLSLIYGPTLISIHDWLLETIICAVINFFRGKICCICLQRRSLWTVISPAMWFLLVLCSSFLCLAISIRLAQLCRSAWSEPEAGLSYGAPQSLGTLVT